MGNMKDALMDFVELYGIEQLNKTMEITAPVSQEIFISRLYKEIDKIVDGIERNPKIRAKDKEDRLSEEIVTALNSAGYNASHDKYNRGHADICVEVKTFKWIGEAKIHTSYHWLYKGFQQLHTRYTTGRECDVGILIYIRNVNANSVMTEWRGRLENQYKKKSRSIDFENCQSRAVTFYSTHAHKSSGLLIKTRHMGVVLNYEPED